MFADREDVIQKIISSILDDPVFDELKETRPFSDCLIQCGNESAEQRVAYEMIKMVIGWFLDIRFIHKGKTAETGILCSCYSATFRAMSYLDIDKRYHIKMAAVIRCAVLAYEAPQVCSVRYV